MGLEYGGGSLLGPRAAVWRRRGRSVLCSSGTVGGASAAVGGGRD